MKLLAAGEMVDGFLIESCVHAGGMAHIYQVKYANGNPEPFPMIMKIPRMTAGDGAENIVSFEVELQILQQLSGTHVPRFVAAGDLERLPYLVMEYVKGKNLQSLLDDAELTVDKPSTQTPLDEVVKIGIAIAHAVHSLHLQNTVHLDLKPANILICPNGKAVLIDFGLSCHAAMPDLLAEEMRKAVGSPAWISPEQIVGVRGDPRSDIFAIGVILYELLTGELPFGAPATAGGMRQRLWMDPSPPRQLRSDIPPWLQEIVMRCLAHEAASRYPSAAHLAFDLSHPNQVIVAALGHQLKGVGAWQIFKRWIRAAGKQYQASPLPTQQIGSVPIVMVALPPEELSDVVLYSLRQAVARTLGDLPGARLACVSVISSSSISSTEDDSSETSVHRHQLATMQRWAQALDLSDHQLSCHVFEGSDAADVLLRYANSNHVSVIVMGAATHGLKMQRLITTVPIKVAMNAPCTVMLVKAAQPFSELVNAD